MTALLIRNVQLADRRRVDLRLAEGRVAAIDPASPAAPATARPGDSADDLVDGSAYVALPAFVDAHLHLDKTLWGQSWVANGGGPTRRETIAHEQQVLAAATTAPIADRAGALLAHIRRQGTLSLCSHVDISPEFGLKHIEAMLSLREQWRDRVTLQLVAFPQTGLLSRPGTMELMETALRLGADVVGGIDPAGFDNDPMGHLRAVFGLAETHGKPIDIHLHDPGELGFWEIARIVEMTVAAGLQGRVMISHAYCLGSLDEARVAALADRLAEAKISLMTAAPAWGPAPPVALLLKHGVTVCCGSDGIRDAWSPFGTGDMLERAAAVAQRWGWATDAELDQALRLATQGGAEALGLSESSAARGLTVGAPADLVLVEVREPGEVLTVPAVARRVIHRGAWLSER
jgi:cytosine deaminase